MLHRLTLSAGNPMSKVLLAVLSFEVIAFGLAIPVMIFVSGHAGALAAATGGGAALLALVSAGLLRKPIGYLLGWITQLVGMALGFVTPAMFVVGLVFLGLWVMSFVLGRRLDAARHPVRSRGRA
jgi:Protein of unknown function (DUF4233)